MESLLFETLSNASGAPAYGLVFVVLLACGLGVPLPEDISLITGGFLVHKGAANLWLMMITGFVGIIAGDSLIFWAGRRLGGRVGRSPGGLIGRIVTPEKRARVEVLFRRHGEKIVMIARFLPGVRAVTYFTAGSAGMPYHHFVFFDGVAAVVSAPVFVYLGYRFGDKLDLLIDGLKRGQMKVVIAIALVAAVFIAYRVIKGRRERARLTKTGVPVVIEPADAVPAPTGDETGKPPAGG